MFFCGRFGELKAHADGTNKPPVIAGSMASVIKQDQILHRQPVQARQKTFLLQLQKSCLVPHSLTAAQIPQSNYCCKIPWLSSRPLLHSSEGVAPVPVVLPWSRPAQIPVPRKKMIWFGGSFIAFPFFFHILFELTLLGGIWVTSRGCVYIHCTFHRVKSWDTKL